MEHAKEATNADSDLAAEASPQGSQCSSGSTRKMATIRDNPSLETPFKHGWRREVVQRAAADDARGGGIRADAYYFSPQGKKLRSIKETEAYLKQSGSPLEIGCFSFSRQLLGAGPPLEELRKARPISSSAAAVTAAAKAAKTAAAAKAARTAAAATAGKKTAVAKKIQRKKHTITIGGASSVIKLTSPVSSNPLKVPRKHSLMEKSRKAFAFKAMELKKKMPVFQSETAKTKLQPAGARPRGRPPGPPGPDRDRVLVRRPWLLAEVDERGGVCCRQPPDAPTTGEYFRLVRATATPHCADNVHIGRTRLTVPCSLFCFFDSPLSPLALPSAQCLVCRCLSHPVCVGLEDSKLTSFVCMDCYVGVGRGRGFDGLGDSVDSESDSESAGDSDASVEELVPGPLLYGPATGTDVPHPPPPLPPPPLLLAGPRFAAPPRPGLGVKRPRGRPRLSGPRQPRPGAMGAVRGAYARRRGLGGGRGSRGARFVAVSQRPSIPSAPETPTAAATAAAATAAAAAAGAQGKVVRLSSAPVGQTAPASESAAVAAAADTPAKKRSWKDP